MKKALTSYRCNVFKVDLVFLQFNCNRGMLFNSRTLLRSHWLCRDKRRLIKMFTKIVRLSSDKISAYMLAQLPYDKSELDLRRTWREPRPSFASRMRF